jgi:hypothetical protein
MTAANALAAVPIGSDTVGTAEAEREGFEPSRALTLRDFQSRALGQTMRPLRAQISGSEFRVDSSGSSLSSEPETRNVKLACGGGGGIRTHEGFSHPTRFRDGRTRPGYATPPETAGNGDDRSLVYQAPAYICSGALTPMSLSVFASTRWQAATSARRACFNAASSDRTLQASLS